MEISKGLQEEIVSVQNKLKNAIRDHQICMGRLKSDPNNSDILGQIQKIQLHIVSLGRCQKQAVQRLRKEVEQLKAENANGAKVSVASLLGLNNNNHIIDDNEARKDNAPDVNGISRSSKDDYEEAVENGDVPSPSEDIEHTKERPCSVETISGEDEVVEVYPDENSRERRVNVRNCKPEYSSQLNFLGNLGLITSERYTDLQNKRAERKRRSTANPQFVYSNWEIPTKRKRHSYLQSAGNAPQTRQTTARLNGPSPPPNKVSSPKPTSPSSRALTKSLIPTHKSTTRPNILRNNSESRVFINKGKLENGSRQVQVSSTKSAQSAVNKSVHIPGLPSSLTIERIENDSTVCINCRNPGSLATCENCSASYHVSCHSISPAPLRTCPKCVIKTKDQDDEATTTAAGTLCKKEDELEEKERERYELRERNSDLRLQVYELEKRSQLLGQSLQLQQRTRQELLGKQEKTQRSIKRLVDFIKLMQHKKDGTSSHPPSASISSLPRPSSSQSPRAPSPPSTPSTSSSSSQKAAVQPQQRTSNNRKLTCPTPQLSSTSCHNSRTSPMCSRSPKCPTPTNCQVAAPNRRSTSHTLSSRKSQTRLPSSEGRPNSCPSSISQKQPKPFPSSAINCQPNPSTVVVTSQKPQSPLPVHPFSSASCPIACPTQLAVTAKSQTTVRSPHSAGSPIRKGAYQSHRPTTTNWNHRSRSTAEDCEYVSHVQNSATGNCELSESQKQSRSLTTSSPLSQSTNWKVQGDANRKSPVVPVQTTIGLDPTVYPTYCSQSITGPISSPIVLTEYKPLHQMNKMDQSSSNCLKTAHQNQSSVRANLNVPPHQSSSDT